MDMRRVAEPLQFLRDPEGPVAVTAGVTDENVGHGLSILAGGAASAPRAMMGRSAGVCKAGWR
jgi:hypothetical protein